jgi:ABC-2 type transport system permease protein
MIAVLSIAKAHVLTSLRERVTLFWFLVFPLFLLTILSLIFGSSGGEPSLNFSITLVVHEQTDSALPFSAAGWVRSAFADLSSPPEAGGQALFSLSLPAPGQELEAFLEIEQTALKRGQRAAVLVLPATFDAHVLGAFSTPAPSGAEALLLMSPTSVASETAATIIEQVFAQLDRALLAQMGRFDEAAAVPHVTERVGGQERGVAYVDLLLPAIILMGFFTNGLFGVPGTILFNRDRKVLRRYWVTPLSVTRYLGGLGIGHLGLCLLQFALVVTLGRFAFGASVSFASLSTILLLVLSAVTFMAFGFLVTALARTANAGMAAANLLNMPMMFLSGMFFPVSGLPWGVQALVLANPVTYLLEAVRHSVGVQQSTLMPWPWPWVVPILWIVFCTAVATRRLRWDVGR